MTKKKWLIIIISLLLVGTAAGGYLLWRRDNQTKDAPPGVNLEPPTEQEKQEADDAKQRIIDQQQQTNQSSSSGKKQANVVITYANHDSVNAYVSNVFEEGGTCTATFTQGATVVNRTSNGFTNVSYTQCAPVPPNLPNSGAWSVYVTYSSAGAEGKSATHTF